MLLSPLSRLRSWHTRVAKAKASHYEGADWDGQDEGMCIYHKWKNVLTLTARWPTLVLRI